VRQSQQPVLDSASDGSAYVDETETNGYAERFIRTRKEQYLEIEHCNTIDDIRQAVTDWTNLIRSGFGQRMALVIFSYETSTSCRPPPRTPLLGAILTALLML
jgi:hypothetical protein